MIGMILAAGKGHRMKPITNKMPKALIQINNSSLIDLAIRKFKRFGIKKIIVNVSYLSEMIEAHIDQQYSNENIVILREDYPYGTGGALINAYPELNDQPFLLMNADVLSEIDLSKLPQGTNFAHLIATHNPDHNNNGDFSIDNDVVVINENQNDFTWSGISIINPKILIPHLGKSYPFDLWKDILIPLVDDKKITAHHDDEFWVDVGNSDRLALARKHFKEEN